MNVFYEKKMDNALRFGDVLHGYILASPNIKAPNKIDNYNIDINLPSFCVVLSPCCSIGNRMISLSPLIKLEKNFFNNPYLAEDMTRINREMNPEQTLPPLVWEKLLPEEKQKRLARGTGYAFVELFIYDRNEYFTSYNLGKEGGIETNYHMIDFRNIHKICCEKIINPQNAPLETKVLQLSIQARAELRDKISFYYGRVPDEDKILED